MKTQARQIVILSASALAISGFVIGIQQSRPLLQIPNRGDRELRAWVLLTNVKMALATPTLDLDSPGFGLFYSSTLEPALEQCTEVIRENPDHKEAYELRAAVFERLGDLMNAAKDRATAADLQ